MRIIWRDVVATMFVGAAVALYGAHVAGAHLPGLGAVRPIAAVVVGLGLAACIVAARPLDSASSGYGQWVGTLATGVFLAAAIAVIGGFELALTALIGVTVALWLTATVRHLFTPKPRITDRDLHGLIDREKVTH